jgi:voltage-gated potassium channel Kch
MTPVSRHAASQWRFLQLTLAIVAWLLVAPYIETRTGGHLAIHVLLLDLILVTIWANPQWRQAGKVIGLLWAISLAASTVSILDVLPQLVQVESTIDIALIAPVTVACIVGVLMFVFRAERPTLDGIFAMVVVYLLIAMVFAELYYMLLIWNREALHLLTPLEQMTSRELRSELMYFSLVTLSTVGYGDVLPVSPLARSLASIQALIGQFYVAVVVATFVALFTTHSLAERAAKRFSSGKRDE